MEKEPKGRDIYFCRKDNLIPVESLLESDTLNKRTGGRGSGRTFRLMLLTLHAASANPGHWIQIVDHDHDQDIGPHFASHFLADRIQFVLKRMHMDHLFELRDAYSHSPSQKRNLYIRFNPKEYNIKI